MIVAAFQSPRFTSVSARRTLAATSSIVGLSAWALDAGAVLAHAYANTARLDVNAPTLRNGPMLLYAYHEDDSAWLVLCFPETPDGLDRLPQLVRTIGTMATARWGSASPPRADSAIADRLIELGRESDDGPHAAWVSYWSPAAQEAVGFKPDVHSSLFYRVESAPPGVFVQLTEAPLDLGRPDHHAALTTLYEALPNL